MNDSNTQHLSDLIKMFYERTKGPDYQYEVRIVQSWEKVVGKFIASHTTDIFIRNGILHVHLNFCRLWPWRKSLKTTLFAPCPKSYTGKKQRGQSNF